MNVSLAAVIITAIVTVAGSWVTARSAARNVEQQSRESDRRRIKDLEDRDAVWEQRYNNLWTAREGDALTKRAMGDHIDVLEAHIWQHLPPPPPTRPPGV